MKLSRLIYVAMIILSTNCFADNEMPCPSIELIKPSASLLDAVNDNPSQTGTFIVTSQNPTVNDGLHLWTVATAPISAETKDLALTQGKKNVAFTNALENKNAYPFGLDWMCIYRSSFSFVPVLAYTGILARHS